MSRWPGKYVIGLTGNIATGKSEWVLDGEGQIDRAKLAKVVFSDPKALERLEAIVQPLVTHAIDILIRRSKHSVVVIEAIKLLETDLAAGCDTIWVVDATEKLQVARLIQKRNMSETMAKQRVASQLPQALKLQSAKIVITNNGSFEDTWDQVQDAWASLPQPEEPLLPEPEVSRPGEYIVRRGRPKDADEIGRFITHATHGKRRMSRAEVMAAFGEKAYLLIEQDSRLAGVTGWQVENLVTRIDELYFEQGLAVEEVIPALMQAVEEASIELQSEASLLFLPPYLAQHVGAWRAVGYKPQTIQGLGVRAWQEAAIETMPRGASLWFKRLREDRILRPL
ncbi:MAG: dephospho-CoA kinase [Anaerolineales bacterium]